MVAGESRSSAGIIEVPKSHNKVIGSDHVSKASGIIDGLVVITVVVKLVIIRKSTDKDGGHVTAFLNVMGTSTNVHGGKGGNSKSHNVVD